VSTADIRYVSTAELAVACSAVEVPPSVSAVLGVPRSGMLPATLVATRMHLPLGMAGCPTVHGGSRIGDLKARKGRILLVDDSALTGKSMAEAKARLVAGGVAEEDIVTCAIYAAPGVAGIDLFVEETTPHRFFEWNMWNSWATKRLMSDMDGVICKDPSAFDDDGPLYEKDIATAPPKFVPRTQVRAIVTNRLERWRDVTRHWLNRHGISVGTLVMRPEATAAERRSKGDPAAFKAEAFKADPEAWMFVESHDVHAQRIAAISGKPVLSVESACIYQKESC
jgi:uncharacterized HAD superfamily protein